MGGAVAASLLANSAAGARIIYDLQQMSIDVSKDFDLTSVTRSSEVFSAASRNDTPNFVNLLLVCGA